jgi:hypothetical protein
MGVDHVASLGQDAASPRSHLILCRKKSETFGDLRCLMFRTQPTMNNLKLVLLLSCLIAATFTGPLVTAAPRGGGGHFSGGQHFAGRPGMGSGQRWSGGNWSGQRWGGNNWRGGNNWHGGNWNGGRNWNGGNWHGRNNWNGNWGHRNNVIFIGDFGFPWGWGWGYPYGYYDYGYPYGGYGYGGYGSGYGGYGSGYGYGAYGYGDGGNGNGYGYGDSSRYGNSSRSRVAELQRRLARAGYYRGSIDGVLGPQTRRAIRAYERNSGYES